MKTQKYKKNKATAILNSVTNKV